MFLDRTVLHVLFTLCVLLLLMLGFSFLYIEPGSEPFVIAILSLVPLVSTLAGIVVLLVLGPSFLEN